MNKVQLDTGLLSLLPEWYREVLEYQQIARAEETVFDALGVEIEAVLQNFFFQTMDESAVGQWEQIFSISPNPSVEILEFRRARLLSRISTRPPLTLGFLYQKLDELIGAGKWKVTVDYPNYTLYIESAAQNQSYATELAYTVNKIKPAHIVYINKPYVQTGIYLSETIGLAQRVYNYKRLKHHRFNRRFWRASQILSAETLPPHRSTAPFPFLRCPKRFPVRS